VGTFFIYSERADSKEEEDSVGGLFLFLCVDDPDGNPLDDKALGEKVGGATGKWGKTCSSSSELDLHKERERAWPLKMEP
jgi:hypothetical protein